MSEQSLLQTVEYKPEREIWYFHEATNPTSTSNTVKIMQLKWQLQNPTNGSMSIKRHLQKN